MEPVTSVPGWTETDYREGDEATENQTDLLNYKWHQPSGASRARLVLCIIQVERGDSWNSWRDGHRDVVPDLRNAVLANLDIGGVDLHDADLYRADLHSATIRGADLRSARLQEADLREADLATADLSEADLSWANLMSTNLPETRLVRARCFAANFGDADLRGADMTDAILNRALLNYAILDLVVFHGADLRGASLNGAYMRGAEMSEAKLGWTGFGHVDLRTVKGLDSCQHHAPSYVDIATLYMSAAGTTTDFFREAGIPENLLTYLFSLVAEPIQFYSCFISYSTEDQAFAERLYADLQASGIRCWFAPHQISAGRKLHEQIIDAIRVLTACS
jgi:uncharacterized protein YjbI with pentapeptide repeats